MFDDTSLICLIIDDLVKIHNWTYEYALDKFYKSNTCQELPDRLTGMFTFAPREIVEMFNSELNEFRLSVG